MPRMVVQGVPIGRFGQHLHVVRTCCWTRDWLLFANALRLSCGYSAPVRLSSFRPQSFRSFKDYPRLPRTFKISASSKKRFLPEASAYNVASSSHVAARWQTQSVLGCQAERVSSAFSFSASSGPTAKMRCNFGTGLARAVMLRSCYSPWNALTTASA
jgi:hypothetical protein